MLRPAWLGGVGLAGGIDKTGERAAELLSLGFASIEFGSVTATPLPGISCGLAALLVRLAAVQPNAGPASQDQGSPAKQSANVGRSAIGIGLGLPPDLPPAQLAGQWLSGLKQLAAEPGIADYLSFNLSAAANRRFLSEPLRPHLFAAISAVDEFRRSADGQYLPPLAVKLPISAAAEYWKVLRAAGIAQLTVVLPDDQPPAQTLATLNGRQGMWRVAVGGIRCAAQRAAAHAAGADAVQIHRLFATHGAACLQRLQMAKAS